MRKFRLVVFVAMLFAMGTSVINLPSCAIAESLDRFNPKSPERTANTNIKPAPIAIGTMRPKGQHLVRPRESALEHRLTQEKKTTPQTTSRQSPMASSYLEELARTSDPWVSPEVQMQALKRQATLATAGAGTSTVQPVTASILALAVAFGGTDTFEAVVNLGDGCKRQEVTTTGPLKGLIPQPGSRDNNTVWYAPEQTTDATFYEKLMFGYEGVGRVRLDLTDPTDKQAGINLLGYTLQDYYDHMAGTGNVVFSGTVEGWITVDHSEGYYGAPSCANRRHDGAGPVSAAQLVVDAVDKFNTLHPDYYDDANSTTAFWPRLDANHDGVVDTFWIIHAGMGQEAGGGAQGEFAIWSQSYDLREFANWPNGYKVYEGDPNTTEDDIVIGPYSILPENVDLGVMVEEIGHTLFGLPDLYPNDGENSIGFWSIMSNGSWGGWLGGATPVGMPLWMRMIAKCGDVYCNWHEPMLTRAYNDSPANIILGQLEDTPDGAYKGLRINLPDINADGETYSQYYLVEWRSNTKYDKMVKTAYVTAFADDDEWFVERVPYNIPGAVIYYYNSRYADSRSIQAGFFEPPSIGPKQQLLVVDMHYKPLRRDDTGEVLSTRAGSYDAALTLQQSKAFTIGTMDSEGKATSGYGFPAGQPVKLFDDAKGYYAGYYAGSSCPDEPLCFADEHGSAVIPAQGSYTTRIVHADGTPYTELYGTPVSDDLDMLLGSGNPGDDGVQYGVTIGLVSKTSDNKMAVLRLNAPLSPDLAISSVSGPSQAKAGDWIQVNYTVANWGYETAKGLKVGVYLSKDNKIVAGSDRLLATQTIASIGARQVTFKEKIVRIPAGMSPRNYYLGAVVDVGSTVAEADETNNALASNTAIGVLARDATSTALWQPRLSFLSDRLAALLWSRY